MSESKLQNKNKNKKVTSSGTNNSELENVSSDVVQQINTIHSVLNGKITKVEILYALKENDHDSNLVIDKFFQGTNDWTVVDNKQKTAKKVKATQGGNNTDNKNKSNNKKPKTQENVQVPKKKKTVDEQDSKASVEAVPAKVKTFVQPQVVEEQKTMSYSQVVSSNQPQKEIIQPTSAQPTKEETKKKSKKNKNVEKPKKQAIQQQISYEPLEQTLTSSFELKQEVVQEEPEEPEEEEEEEEEQSSVILDISNEYNYSDGLNLQFGTLGIQPKDEEKSKNTNQTNFQNSTWDQNQNFMQYQTGQNFYQQPTNQPTTQQQGKKEKTSKYVSNQPTQTQPQQPLQQPSYMPNQYGQFYPYPNPYVMQQYQNYNKQFYGGKYPNNYYQQPQYNGFGNGSNSPQGGNSFGDGEFERKISQQQQYYQQYSQQQYSSPQGKESFDKKEVEQTQFQTNPYPQYQQHPYGNQYNSYMYGQMYGTPFMMNQQTPTSTTKKNQKQEEWKYQ